MNSSHDDRFREDVHLLRSQSERCRDILRRLTTLSSEDEAHMRRLPLSSLIEEIIAPHREFGIKLELIEKSPRAGEPVRQPQCRHHVRARQSHRKRRRLCAKEGDRHGRTRSPIRVTIMIEDDGNGYAPEILTRIGEPYVTTAADATTRPAASGSACSSPRRCWSDRARCFPSKIAIRKRRARASASNGRAR